MVSQSIGRRSVPGVQRGRIIAYELAVDLEPPIALVELVADADGVLCAAFRGVGREERAREDGTIVLHPTRYGGVVAADVLCRGGKLDWDSEDK